MNNSVKFSSVGHLIGFNLLCIYTLYIPFHVYNEIANSKGNNGDFLLVVTFNIPYFSILILTFSL